MSTDKVFQIYGNANCQFNVILWRTVLEGIHLEDHTESQMHKTGQKIL